MLHRISHRSAAALMAATMLAGGGGLVACTGSDGASEDLVVDDGDGRAQALDAAGGASFQVASGTQQRVTADGVRLGVGADYFESVRLGDWTAPEECSFNTQVRLSVGIAESGSSERLSQVFEGPTADTDATTTGVLATVVEGRSLAPGSSGPATTVDGDPGAGEPIGEGISGDGAPTGSSIDGVRDDTVMADGETSTTLAAAPDADEAPTTPAAPPAPVESVAPPEPPAPAPPVASVVALVVVAFAHDSIATLRFDPPVDGSPYSAVDTQPADGWTPLALLVPASEFERGELPSLELTIAGADEVDTIELDAATLGGPPDPTTGVAEDVQILTDDWRFDTSAVGPQCDPPEGRTTPDNAPRPDDADIVGRSIRPAPELPPAGEQPSDPAGATAEALDAIRAVYDIADLYDDRKAERTEDPAVATRIFDELRKNKVIEPYLSNLDPVFGAVVFTAPSEAAVVYRVGPSYQWEIGRVREIDGRWKLAIGTLCRDLGDASYTCPGVEPDDGPGPLG